MHACAAWGWLPVPVPVAKSHDSVTGGCGPSGPSTTRVSSAPDGSAGNAAAGDGAADPVADADGSSGTGGAAGADGSASGLLVGSMPPTVPCPHAASTRTRVAAVTTARVAVQDVRSMPM